MLGTTKTFTFKYFGIVNPNTHTKFFLIATELMHLAEEAKEMDGTMTPNYGTQQYTCTLTALVKYEIINSQLGITYMYPIGYVHVPVTSHPMHAFGLILLNIGSNFISLFRLLGSVHLLQFTS